MLMEGQDEMIFEGLNDPFYAVDSRDYQVIQPYHNQLRDLGGKVLCIEKDRPHVPFERAIMAIRFTDYMIGTQFHPEADAIGMSLHLQTEERKKVVIESHGYEKWESMIEHLNDPDKILWTMRPMRSRQISRQSEFQNFSLRFSECLIDCMTDCYI